MASSSGCWPISRRMKAEGGRFAGQQIADLVTVNGVRVVAEDGTWGLVRASSNKPELVVVVESPVSAERRREMFEAVDAVLRRNPGSRRLQPDLLIGTGHEHERTDRQFRHERRRRLAAVAAVARGQSEAVP